MLPDINTQPLLNFIIQQNTKMIKKNQPWYVILPFYVESLDTCMKENVEHFIFSLDHVGFRCLLFVPIKEERSGGTVDRPLKIQTTNLVECRQLDTHKLIFILCTENSPNLTCSLYHKILILQKFSHTFTQVLQNLSFNL